MQLAAGDYNIKVAAGDSVAASFDKTFYRGEKDFSIHAGQSSSVSVECIIANTLVTVEFAKSLTQAFQSYEVQVASSAGSLTFTSDNPNAIGYASLSAVEGKDTVKTVTVGGVACTEATVLDGSYAIQRPFVLVTKTGETLSPAAQAFFDYATSSAASQLIKAAGAVPVAK